MEHQQSNEGDDVDEDEDGCNLDELCEGLTAQQLIQLQGKAIDNKAGVTTTATG